MTGIPDVIPQRYDPCIPLGRLTEHPANPNQGDEGSVCESLDAHGFYGAVLVQESTGIVFAGNTRLRSARDKGMPGIPGFWCDVDDDTRDRILSVDNEATRKGRNDESKLVALLTGLAQQPRGLEGTGFDGDDLDALIAAMGGTGGGPGLNGDPDDVPEPPEAPVSVPGDLWRIGEHRLLVGDATDMAAVEKMLAVIRGDIGNDNLASASLFSKLADLHEQAAHFALAEKAAMRKPRNSLSPMASLAMRGPLPWFFLSRGSCVPPVTATLYGGSVQIMSARRPSIRRPSTSGSVESPHSSLCSPSL